jgi:hypothetical protein
MAARVGLVLSGCGVMDGGKSHEAVSILVALDRRGANTVYVLPTIQQSTTRVVSTPCYMNNVGPWTVCTRVRTRWSKRSCEWPGRVERTRARAGFRKIHRPVAGNCRHLKIKLLNWRLFGVEPLNIPC